MTKETTGPVVWLDVYAEEDVKVSWKTTVSVPSGLSEEDIHDLLLEDRYLRRIYQSENMEIIAGIEDYGMEWKPQGQLWDCDYRVKMTSATQT